MGIEPPYKKTRAFIQIVYSFLCSIHIISQFWRFVNIFILFFLLTWKKKESCWLMPGIRLWRRYPLPTPEKRAFLSSVGVCEPDSLCFARRKVDTKCDLRHQNKKDTPCGCPFVLEVQAGFEPADNGVADRGLTTWLLHQTYCAYLL